MKKGSFEFREIKGNFDIEFEHKKDKSAFIKVTVPVPVNHCPTCGAKLKKVRK